MIARETLKRWLKFLVALGISLVFSVLFLLSIDLAKAASALADANYLYVVPALGLFAISLVFRSLRWQYFYGPARGLGWRVLLSPLLIGYAGNNLLPLRAGELLRAQILAERRGIPRMVTFGTLMMERLFDGFILAAFLVWGLLLAGTGGAYLGAGLLIAALALVGFAAGTLLAHNPRLPARLVSRPLPFVPDRLRDEVASLSESFLGGFTVLTSASRFGLAALTSAAAWGLELLMYWVISRAFSLDASFITIAFAGSAANVAMSIPSAQGGVGPFQVLALQALLQFGVARSAAAAYAVALHIFLVGPVSLVGLFFLWHSTAPAAAPAAAAPGLAPTGVEPTE